MCFNYTITQFQEYLEKRFQAKFASDNDKFKPKYIIQAFTFPSVPVILNIESEKIIMIKWGLIPFWAKDKTAAEKIRTATFNARNDTVFEKPSFRNSIRKKRCIVMADGFFEWHEHNGKKYPFYITFKDRRLFSFAGLWDEWTDNEKGNTIKTFSILTTDANPMLRIIHNSKMRMPVILNEANEKKWLSEINDEEIKSLLIPCMEKEMTAYTVSKSIIQKGINSSDPDIIKEIKYEELIGINF